MSDCKVIDIEEYVYNLVRRYPRGVRRKILIKKSKYSTNITTKKLRNLEGRGLIRSYFKTVEIKINSIVCGRCRQRHQEKFFIKCQKKES